jgi:hypothetical protein
MHHRRDRSFAVGAGDMEREKRSFGVIERVAEMTDVFETQLDAEGLERKEPC